MANLLLLEPDAILGRTYQAVLTQNGHHVSWFRNASSAISNIDQVQPHLIITELQLPMHNGVEFLYELRSYQDLAHIPVILITSVPPMLKAFSSNLWQQLGVAAYHYKPLTKLSNLSRSVDRILAPIS